MRVTASPLVCRAAVALMSDYLDGALSRRLRRRLEAHLARCPHCTTYLDQIREIVAASGAVVPDDLEPAALDALVTVFLRFHNRPDTPE